MKNPRTMIFSRQTPPFRWSRKRLSGVVLVLAGIGTTGCYHATGFQRPNLVAEEIPSFGGDYVTGLKAAAGPGDFFLGNDNVCLAIDGTPFGEPEGSTIASALSGGSIVDVGLVRLDRNYKRVNLPTDFLERLTPVVNQDPELPLVFDRFVPSNTFDSSQILMTGGLCDPQHKVSGATWDALGRVQGLEVQHRVRLGRQDLFFVLETTLINKSNSNLGVRNIGDALIQQGGGYRLNIPATEDADGRPVTGWGVDFSGSDFKKPLESSVKASMIALMAPESAGSALDCHASLGIMPEKNELLWVAADSQKALTEYRPIFPKRMVVGGNPIASLPPGGSLTYSRKLFIQGGSSVENTYAVQATAVFNQMTYNRQKELDKNVGQVQIMTFGSASRSGTTPAQMRIERNVGTDAAPIWKLERTEFWETADNPDFSAGVQNPFLAMILPEGNYRVSITNRTGKTVIKEKFYDFYSQNERTNLELPLISAKDTIFQAISTEYLCPERDEIVSPSGTLTSMTEGLVGIVSRPMGAEDGTFQPARFTISGRSGTADPWVRRSRNVTGIFDIDLKRKEAIVTYLGAYHFIGGNQVFGSRMKDPVMLSLPMGKYNFYATRGPLSFIDHSDVELKIFQDNRSIELLTQDQPHPDGWISFDVPGPSMATSGNLHPTEIMSSSLAEFVNVVGFVETDNYADVKKIRDDFRLEVENMVTSEAQRKPVGQDPILVGGRQSDLMGTLSKAGFGTASTLFTPNPEPWKRRGGARISKGWSLADFMAQGGGAYTIVHQPRGTQGLFTLQGFDPTTKLGQGANAWWNATGPLSLGRTQGSFDALELIRAEGLDGKNPDAWFTTFKQVRNDWFALLNQQTPSAFTKGLGLSSARFTMDTPIGLARTYLKAKDFDATKQDSLLKALQSGACVASTGPLLDATLGTTGLGGTFSGAAGTLTITAYAPFWMPLDEVRVVVNGQVIKTLPKSAFTQDATDPRKFTASVPMTFGTTTDAWVVVEAGVPLDTKGAYRVGEPWHAVMKGIYPLAVTNPIWVDTNGGGYQPVWK